MKKTMILVNWNKSQLKDDINPVPGKYEKYPGSRGFRESGGLTSNRRQSTMLRSTSEFIYSCDIIC